MAAEMEEVALEAAETATTAASPVTSLVTAELPERTDQDPDPESKYHHPSYSNFIIGEEETSEVATTEEEMIVTEEEDPDQEAAHSERYLLGFRLKLYFRMTEEAEAHPTDPPMAVSTRF